MRPLRNDARDQPSLIRVRSDRGRARATSLRDARELYRPPQQVALPLDVRTAATLEAPLSLAKLPAEIVFVFTPLAAAVRVEGVDVGATPLRIERPPGTYRVLLARQGYVPYAAAIKVARFR